MHSQMKIFSFSFFLFGAINAMESAVSFAPLSPAGFVNFTGRGKACFLQGGAKFKNDINSKMTQIQKLPKFKNHINSKITQIQKLSKLKYYPNSK